MPRQRRQSKIDERLALAQKPYNRIPEKAGSPYHDDEDAKISQSVLDQCMKEAVDEYRNFLKLYSQTRQDVFIRVQKAYQNFS